MSVQTVILYSWQRRREGVEGADHLGRQSGGVGKIGVKFNKLEFLKLLPHVLND